MAAELGLRKMRLMLDMFFLRSDLVALSFLGLPPPLYVNGIGSQPHALGARMFYSFGPTKELRQ